ncbi:MAG: hypothetical protein QM820_15135 [Minicystis sp.]
MLLLLGALAYPVPFVAAPFVAVVLTEGTLSTRRAGNRLRLRMPSTIASATRAWPNGEKCASKLSAMRFLSGHGSL